MDKPYYCPHCGEPMTSKQYLSDRQCPNCGRQPQHPYGRECDHCQSS